MIKWSAIQTSANILNTVFGALWREVGPKRQNQIGWMRFYGYDGTLDISPLQLATPPFPPIQQGSPSIQFRAPIGDALVQAYKSIPYQPPSDPSEYRQRVLVLLTDGDQNIGQVDVTEITDSDADAPGYIPSVRKKGLKGGYRIFSVSYGPTASAVAEELENLSAVYSGRYYSTESDLDPNDPRNVYELFLSLLSDVVPVEPLTSSGNPNGPFPIEQDVEKAVFISVDDQTTELQAGCIEDGNNRTTQSGRGGGFRWCSVEKPVAGDWLIEGAGGATYLILKPLLRTRFGVESNGVGQPAKVWAKVRYKGAAISDAQISVTISRPKESLGDVTGGFVKQGGLTKAILSGNLTLFNTPKTKKESDLLFQAPDLHAKLSPTKMGETVRSELHTAIEPCGVHSVDTPTARRQLLVSAETERNKPFEYETQELQLKETRPGRYEAVLDNTDIEGSYGFRFTSEGETPAGTQFRRTYKMSKPFLPIPSAENTSLSWRYERNPKTQENQWTATVVPKTATNRLLGPTYGKQLRFATTGSAEIGLGELETIDNLDGSYSVNVTLADNLKAPDLLMAFGSSNQHPVPLTADNLGQAKKVTVRLTQIQVATDKESWFPSPGEIVFDSVIAPNSNPNRAIRRRIPEKGVLSLRDRQSEKLDIVLFDEYLEEGASLDISLGGTEFDWLLFFTKKDEYARYRRVLSGPMASWAGQYSPDDEPDDPELLKDWALWYTVEINT